MWLIQYTKEETGNLHHVTGPRRICRLADLKLNTLCEFGLGGWRRFALSKCIYSSYRFYYYY